jgi:hypothetical protein
VVTELAAVSPLEGDSPPEEASLEVDDPLASRVPLELRELLEDADSVPELVIEDDDASLARLVRGALPAAAAVLALVAFLVLERVLALRLAAARDFFALALAAPPGFAEPAALAARRLSEATSAGSWPEASWT